MFSNDYANFVFTFLSFRFFHSTKYLADINLVVVSRHQVQKSLFCAYINIFLFHELCERPTSLR